MWYYSDLHTIACSNTGENIMRIIKLSPKDVDFPNRESVDEYFNNILRGRDVAGKFLLTKGRISANGITAGETIIFSYETEITHIAKASSGRRENFDLDRESYPYYFLVDVNTIVPAKGYLYAVESSLAELGIIKNIVRTQGWPLIPDTPKVAEIWHSLKV
jgi:hypothetical protein